jgi:TonB family protein
MKSIFLFILIFIAINEASAKKSDIKIQIIDYFQEEFVFDVQFLDEKNKLIGTSNRSGYLLLEKPKNNFKLKLSKKDYYDTTFTINSKMDYLLIEMRLLPEIIEKLKEEIKNEACIEEIQKITMDSLTNDPYFETNENQALMRYFTNEIRYPQFAIERDIQGKVFVEFIVELDGTVSCVRILKGISYCIDKEAIRVIKKMTKWVPAKKNGVQVRAVISIPLTFKIK